MVKQGTRALALVGVKFGRLEASSPHKSTGSNDPIIYYVMYNVPRLSTPTPFPYIQLYPDPS